MEKIKAEEIIGAVIKVIREKVPDIGMLLSIKNLKFAKKRGTR